MIISLQKHPAHPRSPLTFLNYAGSLQSSQNHARLFDPHYFPLFLQIRSQLFEARDLTIQCHYSLII